MPDTSLNRPHLQPDLFRPSLVYPSHPYSELLTRTAERFPENEAVIFKDVNLSYRELEALFNAFANALLDLGIRKGHTVCLFLRNRAEYLVSWFAITRIGAAVSPMNPSYKEREVAYQVSNSEAVAIVIQHDLLPLVESVRPATPGLKYVIVVGADAQMFPPAMFSFGELVQTHPPTSPTGLELGWEDVIALPYSSGTTGLPKGVMLSQKNLVCNAYQSIAYRPLRLVAQVLPPAACAVRQYTPQAQGAVWQRLPIDHS